MRGRVLVLSGSMLAAAAAHAVPCLKRSALLYHQGRYDSALAALGECRSETLKRRDSLALFQYSGMAEARLGRAAAAAKDFRALLALDSLFQFPRNEDSAVLAAFAQAHVPAAGEPSAAASSDTSLGAPAAPASAVSAAHAVPAPARPAEPWTNPLPDKPYAHDSRGIGLAMGAIPLGGGWLTQGRYTHGWTLAFLQAGGMALSLYASSRLTSIKNDPFGVTDSESPRATGWRITQAVSLSTALGAYLFSLFASRKD